MNIALVSKFLFGSYRLALVVHHGVDKITKLALFGSIYTTRHIPMHISTENGNVSGKFTHLYYFRY